jgi:hypothetical protein
MQGISRERKAIIQSTIQTTMRGGEIFSGAAGRAGALSCNTIV